MNRPTRRRAWKAALALAAAALLAVAPAAAIPVYLELAGGEAGLGLARSRGDECYVVAPRVVLAPALADPEAEIELRGAAGARGVARGVESFGTRDDDVAIARVVENAAGICDATDDSRDLFGRHALLVMRQKSGALAPLLVEIGGGNDRILGITLAAGQPAFADSMRGALLLVDGKPRGLLGRTDPASREARVVELRFAARMVGGWVTSATDSLESLEDALSILRQAAESRPAGDSGQVAAAEALVRAGRSLAGFDFAGLVLRGATLGDATLERSDLRLADLAGAALQRAALAESRLDFANLDHADLAGADLRNVFAPFARGAKTRFDGAELSGSDWFMALLPGVSFRGATLRDATFYLTDLTGADFSGVDLTDVMFIQCVLTGADFTGARFDNTDLTSSILEPGALGDEQQRGVCRRDFFYGGRKEIELLRQVPTTRYDSGFKYEEILEERVGTPVDSDSGMDFCRRRPGGEESRWPIEADADAERIQEWIKLAFPQSLFIRGRRQEKLEAAFYEHLKQVGAPLASERFFSVEGTGGADLAAVLRQRLDDYRPRGPVRLDAENAPLLLMKHFAEEQDDEFWRASATSSLAREFRRRRGLPEPIPDGPWPRFFPEGTVVGTLDDEHLRLYREWTARRVGVLPDELWLRRQVGIPTLSYIGRSAAKGQQYWVQPFAREMYGGDAWSDEFVRSSLGAEPERVVWMELVENAAIVLPQPLESYLFELPAGLELPDVAEVPDVETLLRLEKVEWVESRPGSRRSSKLLVLRVMPLRTRVAHGGQTLHERQIRHVAR